MLKDYDLMKRLQLMAEYEGNVEEPYEFSSEITEDELLEICEKTGFYELDCSNIVNSGIDSPYTSL